MAENNLFTIDLLKGQGVPHRKQKGMLVAVLAALAIPVLIFLFMFARYTTASIMLPLKQKEFNNLVQQSATSKDAKIQKQISEYNKCLREIAIAVNDQSQWSSVIEQAIASMPNSLIMENLSAVNEVTIEKVQSKGESSKTNTIRKTNRILNATLSMDAASISEIETLAEVNSYIEQMKEKCLFNGEIKKQETQTIDGKRIKKYYIQFNKIQES